MAQSEYGYAAAGVPAQPSIADFSCDICFELCVDPVVGNCGHDFCKDCLTRWTTQHRRPAQGSVTCPVCRGTFAATAVQDLCVCIRLRDMIQLLFPEELARRRAEVQRDDAAEGAAAEAAAAAARADTVAAAVGLSPSMQFGQGLQQVQAGARRRLRVVRRPAQMQQQEEGEAQLDEVARRLAMPVQQQEQQQWTAAAHAAGSFSRPEGTSPAQPLGAAAGVQQVGAAVTFGAQMGPHGMLAGFPFAAAAGAAFPAAAPWQPAGGPAVPLLPAQPVFTMGWYTPKAGSSNSRRANLRFQRPGRSQARR